MKLKFVERLEAISPAAWNALLPPRASCMIEHGYLNAFEISGALARERLEPRHVTVWDGDRLVAAMPCYWNHAGERGDQLPDWGRIIATRNELPYGASLFIGIPFTWTTAPKLLTAPDADREALVALLVRGARELVGEQAQPAIHFYFSTEDEARTLENHGFMRRVSPHYAWINRGYGSFDDYAADLRSKARHKLKTERAAVRALGLRYIDVAGADITAAHIDQLWRFHTHTIEKHGPAADFYPRAYFDALRAQLGHRMELRFAERDGEPVAAAFFLTSPDSVCVRQWGAAEHIRYLHFEVTWYQTIEDAIRRGLHRIDAAGGEGHKLERGFIPVWLTHSASWFGDPDLHEAASRLVVKERARAQQLCAEQRTKAPHREPPAMLEGPP